MPVSRTGPVLNRPVINTSPCKSFKKSTIVLIIIAIAIVIFGMVINSPKWTHKVDQIAQPFSFENSPIFLEQVQSNRILHKSLRNSRSVHILNSQDFILSGTTHLKAESSTVVVFGAQFSENRFVEPLPELLTRSAKLILVDIDPNTLKLLKKKLNSPKVITKTLDLSRCSEKLAHFEDNLIKEKPDQRKFFFKTFLFLGDLEKELREKSTPFSEILPAGEKADFVVSSLVRSQLFHVLKWSVKRAFIKLFKEELNNYFDRNLDMEVVFDELLLPIKKAISRNHLNDLKNLSGNRGSIYIADTFKNGGIPTEEPSLMKEFLNFLRKQNGSLEERSWTWEEFDVKAFLLKFK